MSKCDYNYDEDAVKEVQSIVGDPVLARKIIRANNGHSIRYTRYGAPSTLFQELRRITGNDRTALKLKIGMYTDLNADREPSAYDLTAALMHKDIYGGEKKNYVLLKDELNINNINNEEEIRRAIISHTIDRIKKHFDYLNKSLEGNDKIIYQSTKQFYKSLDKQSIAVVDVIDSNPERRMKKITKILGFVNGLYGGVALATYDRKLKAIIVSPTDSMITSFQNRMAYEVANKERLEAEKHQRYAEKEGNYFVRDGEIIPVYDRLPSTPKTSGNVFETINSNLKTLLVYQRNSINATINSLRLKAKTSKNYSKYIQRLSHLIEIRNKYDAKISELNKKKLGITTEIVESVIEYNFKQAESLLMTGNPDDLYKAMLIYDAYSKIDDFKYVGDNDNPLVPKDLAEILAKTYEIEDRINDLLIKKENFESNELKIGIANEIARLKELLSLSKMLSDKAKYARTKYQELKEKTLKFAVDTINSFEGTEKLYGRKLTIDDILSPKKDIDWLSAMILGIGRTYDFGGEESILANAIYKIVSDATTEKNAELVKFSKKFDVIERKIRRELKRNKHDYKSVFLKRNKFGTYTFHLIDRFNDNWYSFINRINFATNKQIRSTKSDQRKIENAYLKKFRSLNLTTIENKNENEKNILVDPMLLPEVIEEFKDDPILSKYANNKLAFVKAPAIRDKMIARYGHIKYDEIVAKQIDKLREYVEKVRSIVSQAAIDFEIGDPNFKTRAEFETLIRTIGSEEINNKIMAENPFLAIKAINNNGIIKNGIAARLTYNVVLPYSNKYFNTRFDTIEHNETYSEFYKVAKDAVSYINDVLTDTDLRLTGMSTMMISNSLISTLMRKDIPFLYKIRNFIRAEKDYFIRFLSGSKFVANPTDNSLEISKAGFNSPDKREYNTYKKVMDYFKTLGFTKEGYKPLNNYNDEIIRTIATIAEIPKSADSIAKYLGINAEDKIRLDNLVKGVIEKRIEDEGNFDLGKILKLYTKLASAYDGRNDIISTIEILRQVYKEIPKYSKERTQLKKIYDAANNTEKQPDRKNANKKMDSYFTRVVRNYHGVRPMRIAKSKKFYTTQDVERIRQIDNQVITLKKKLDEPELTEKEIEEINNKIEALLSEHDNIGKIIDLSSIISVLTMYVVFRGLAYNPKTLMNNFTMGQFTNILLDHSGLHWTPGNYVYATKFLRRKLFNTKNKILRNVTEHHSKKYHSIRIAEILFTRSQILDDVRNELQKADKYVGKETLKNKLHPYYMSITGPEWYNQVGPALAVLMDIKIKDSFGNEYPAFTKDGHFTMYDESVEGLKLKPEFKYKYDKNGNPTNELSEEGKKNVEDWEELKGPLFKDYKLRAKDAIKDGQGDFSQLSGIMAKDHSLGRLVMVLRTWIGQYLWLMFGKEENIVTGKKRSALIKHFTPASLATALGLTTAVAVGPYASLAAAGLSYATSKIMFKNVNRYLIHYASDIRETIGFLGTIIESMGALLVNYTSGKKIVPVNSQVLMGFKVNNNLSEEDAKEAQRLLQEHREAMDSLSVVLASSLLMMGMILGVHKLLHCGDYEQNTIRCKRMKNLETEAFNILSGLYDDMTMAINPYSLYQLIQLRILDSTLNRILNFTNAVEAHFENEDIQTHGENRGKSKLSTRSWLLLPGPMKTIDEVNKIWFPRQGTIKPYNQYYVERTKSDTDKLKSITEQIRALRKEQLMHKFKMYSNIPKKYYDNNMKEINRILDKNYPTYEQLHKKYLKYYSEHDWETKYAKRELERQKKILNFVKKEKIPNWK